MFEFHGWINISCRKNDEEDLKSIERRQSQLCSIIQEKLHQVEWCNGIFKIFRGVNGEDHLLITGCSNHHQQEVIDFLYWLAGIKSDSYGLLHVIDDDKICMNEMHGIKVWRIIKDEVVEFTDPILGKDINRMLNVD